MDCGEQTRLARLIALEDASITTLGGQHSHSQHWLQATALLQLGKKSLISNVITDVAV